jgi:hypothetical protein
MLTRFRLNNNKNKNIVCYESSTGADSPQGFLHNEPLHFFPDSCLKSLSPRFEYLIHVFGHSGKFTCEYRITVQAKADID